MQLQERQSESVNEVLQLRVSNFNVVVAFLGGFLSLFGLVSFLLKEKFYLSEARMFGVPFVCGKKLNS